MLDIRSDIKIDSDGSIRYIGAEHGAAGAGYYTVQELHRFVSDLADDAEASGDDIMDITLETPSGRQTQYIIDIFAPYNIDQALSEHLFDGSIIQNGGDDIWDGFVNYGNEGVEIYLMQEGIVVVNDFWNKTPEGETLSGLNRLAASGISHRFLQKVRTSGVDIDGRRLVGLTREFGKTSKEFAVAGTGRGNNTLALDNSGDLNNTTDIETVSGWTDITNTEGYNEIDVDEDGTNNPFYSKWTKAQHPINDVYEYGKYLASYKSGETIYGLPADTFRGVTHEIPVDTPVGSFETVEPISWDGGTGQLLAIDSLDGGTKIWMQLLTGVIPELGTTITGGTSSATVDVSGALIARPKSFTLMGASTGSSIIAAYGIGINKTDLKASDKLTDLNDLVINPPMFVTYSVAGLVVGEDRVLVAAYDGVSVDEQSNPKPFYSQASLNSALAGGEDTVTISTAIPLDTPSEGTIRIANGLTYAEVTYTGFNGVTFTGCAEVPAAEDGAYVWITYIDKLAESTTETFTCVYQDDRNLMIRVRDGADTPIKTFITTGTLTSNGGSVTVIRTSDA